ncbi:MAG: membrane protein insertion efficiency factor YidD [Pseudomonadota bacterium]
MQPSKHAWHIRAVCILLRGYQALISPVLGNNCRYQPTCSQYAIEAVQRFGVFKGLWLTMRRLSRCHPWGGHGHDPVPDAPENRSLR